MSKEYQRPEEVLAALFAGLERRQQMALMARLEHTGASLYRSWADSEPNIRAREELMASAEREGANAELLRLMITPKTECERCHRSLPIEDAARSCSFQCTFCPPCAENLTYKCPNCAGDLIARSSA